MPPLLPSPDHYLFNLYAMTSSDAKRLWREAIKQHWSCRCAYCHEIYDANELTLDHVKPRTYGGPSMTSNLVPSCRRCNREKGSRNWLDWMRETFGTQPQREELILSWIKA